MIFGDTTTYVYQFIFDKDDNNDKNIIKYFVMHGLGLCIRLNTYVAHMFYEWSFSNNTSVPIDMNPNNYQLSLNI